MDILKELSFLGLSDTEKLVFMISALAISNGIPVNINIERGGNRG